MRRIVFIASLVLLAAGAARYFLGSRAARVVAPGPSLSIGKVLGGDADPAFLRAVAPRRFSFPADHGPHPGYRNEWWYFTGNLKTADGRRFGYQLTFFRAALAAHAAPRSSAWGAKDIFMAHFAVTDVDGKRFRFAERFSRAALGLAGASAKPFAVFLDDWSARGTTSSPFGVRLTAREGEMALDLDLESLKPEVLNGEGGLSRKSATPGNASYYYSIPRLSTRGSIRIGKESFSVAGLSWLDREWSTSALDQDQQGWDWFALQLEDGRDIMYYQLRKLDGSSDPFSGGTMVLADGSSRSLKRDEVELTAREWWTSRKSGARYPSKWHITIPAEGLDLEIVPRLADQEFSTGFRYWEGAVAVRGRDGKTAGSGYLEMTGYPVPGKTAQ